MISASTSARRASGRLRDPRLWPLGLLVLGVLFAVAVAPPIPTPPALVSYADQRTLLGIPNFFDVVSNAPFLLVGGWGLYFLAERCARAFTHTGEAWPWALFFLSVVLTGLGSAYYHLDADAARLTWDRLPIALGATALLAAVIAERISLRAGVYLAVPLLIIGAASVLYWQRSVLAGAEDVLPYAAVQYGSILAVVLIAALYPSRYTRGSDWYAAVAIYAAAKAAEVLDASIYALGEIVSGHTLKHLLAALAVGWLLRMLQLRSAL